MILAWGKRVSSEFRVKVIEISVELQIDPSWLMACMAFESGGTFRADIRNAAGSGATGLIQFMPSTAQALGTTTNALAAMAPVEQLEYVRKYFLPSKGRLNNLDDVYMAILWPAAIGRTSEYVLFDRADVKHPKRYMQNRGLDWNKDGKVTKAEAAAKVRAKLEQGLRVENAFDTSIP